MTAYQLLQLDRAPPAAIGFNWAGADQRRKLHFYEVTRIRRARASIGPALISAGNRNPPPRYTFARVASIGPALISAGNCAAADGMEGVDELQLGRR